jgi:hypothetical protein
VLKVKDENIKVISIYDLDNLKELQDWFVKMVRAFREAEAAAKEE